MTMRQVSCLINGEKFARFNIRLHSHLNCRTVVNTKPKFYSNSQTKSRNMNRILIFAAFVATTSGNIVIESPLQTNWGNWGAWSRCPFGTYTQAIQIRTEPYQGTFDDDTAANGIRLYCGNPQNASTIYITSTVGDWGNWGSVFSCRSDDRPIAPDGYITGFQLRVEGPLTLGDDTATNNVRIFCSYPGTVIPEQTKEGDGLTYGSWRDARRCNQNQAICALQTQVEPYQGKSGNKGSSDDTAMNNIRGECCNR